MRWTVVQSSSMEPSMKARVPDSKGFHRHFKDGRHVRYSSFLRRGQRKSRTQHKNPDNIMSLALFPIVLTSILAASDKAFSNLSCRRYLLQWTLTWCASGSSGTGMPSTNPSCYADVYKSWPSIAGAP
eukprot:5497231-Amphidinium_carterae.1